MTHRARRGMTLVELLVVAGLMAGFLGLMVAGLRQSGGAQIGPTLQGLASAVMQTQSRALGRDAGAAILLEPGTNDMLSYACNTVLSADVPPFIVGAVSGSAPNGMPPADLAASSATVALVSIDNGDVSELQQGYRIRFSGITPTTATSPWFGFTAPASGAICTVAMRADAGQTADNTVWPRGAAGSPLRYEVARYPQKSVPLVTPSKGAAIDLRYSGVGDAGSGNYASFATTNANKGAIAICFDREGRLDAVMQYGAGSVPTVQPLAPTAPLYLLVASVVDIQQNSSLRSTASRWLAIAPSTGRVSIAANVPVSGTTGDEIKAARANARAGVTQGVGR